MPAATNPPQELKALQQWMLDLITQSTPPLSAEQLAGHISLPPQGERQERLNIYVQGYLLRLQECLRADFPATHQLMGSELFDFFISSYIYQEPSRSPSLFDMGKGFAEFLQQSQGAQAKHNPALQLPLDMVQLERLRSEVIRAKGVEGESHPPSDPFALLSGLDLTLQSNPSLRLITLQYPLIEYIDAVEQQQPLPALPESEVSHIVLSRLHYRVSMHYLEPWQYHLLQALQQTPSLAEGVTHAAAKCQKPSDEILAELMVWLPIAQQQGWLI